MKPGVVDVKVMCVFLHNGKLLAGRGYDKEKDQHFARVLGGGLEFGETTEEGIRREVREELGCEIENLEFLKVVENIFTYEGKAGHQITFLFRGELSNKDLYNQEKIHIVELTYEVDAEWIPVADILEGRVILYPATDWKKVLKVL